MEATWDEEPPKHVTVSADMYAAGWQEQVGQYIEVRTFEEVRRFQNGLHTQYVVVNPHWIIWKKNHDSEA